MITNRWSLVALVFLLTACAKKIKPYVDIDPCPLPKISLTEYKSVQLRNTKYQDPELAIGVAISGGGSRAQYYGLGVLMGFEEICNKSNTNANLLKEIDYFSTVSGGGYSAGYYLSVLKNSLSKDTISFRNFYFSKGENFNDAIGKSAQPLLILRSRKNERGFSYSMTRRLDYEVLQYSDKKSTNKFSTRMLIGDFFISKKDTLKPSLPMLVANGTIFNNGERVAFMPHVISALRISESLRPNLAELPTGTNGINDGYSLPLTYAITASSAFPGVLPATKFGIKGTKSKIIRIIDGGAVDNLGFSSMLELLDSDTTVKHANKRAVIIDCSGEGQVDRYSENKRLKLLQLLEHTSLLTVSTKYSYLKDAISYQAQAFGISDSNYMVLGFSTLRDHLKSMEKDTLYEKVKAEISKSKNKNTEWFKLYIKFKKNILELAGKNEITRRNGKVILSSISSTKFKEFKASDILILYEYAAQVETKLKIFPDERDMLLLAGRYTVFIEKERLSRLLNK